MEFLMFWLMFSVVVAIIAASRNRSGFGWFCLSVLISPFLAVILVLALGKVTVDAAPLIATSDGSAAVKKCPFCAEDIRPEAVKCKHCGSVLVTQSEG